ncbi:MAG: hypothetical protein BWK76_21550 [Desulfobulbaceae bacterium A2]|nr:MAG: hypothetical protein BWK76_21550 [Desulfobulbaceae bacterium A2]
MIFTLLINSIKGVYMKQSEVVSGLMMVLGVVLLVGSLVCPAMGKERFTVSSEGVIKDSQTMLEWVVMPGENITSYNKAEAWLKECKIAGGGWRMPTEEELKSLYKKGLGKFNLDPVFKVSQTATLKSDGHEHGTLWVWAETPSLTLQFQGPVAMLFTFDSGSLVGNYLARDGRHGLPGATFGVRSVRK